MSSGRRETTAGVRVRFVGGDVLLGDPKNDRFGDRAPTIRVSSRRWTMVLDALWHHRPGDRDISLAIDRALSITVDSDGRMTMTSLATGTELFFTPEETDAFLDGVRHDEFDNADAVVPRQSNARTRLAQSSMSSSSRAR